MVRVTRFNLSFPLYTRNLRRVRSPATKCNEILASVWIFEGIGEDRFQNKESRKIKKDGENGNYRRVECKSRIRFRIDLLLEI